MKKIVLSGILLFLHIPVVMQATTPNQRFVREYQRADIFLDDFMDLSKKPHEPIKYWAAQLIMLLSNNEALKPFFVELAQAVQHRNPRRIACLFALHEHTFSKELQALVRSKDLMKIWTALEARIQK